MMKNFLFTLFILGLGLAVYQSEATGQQETKKTQPLIPVSGNAPADTGQKKQGLDESKFTPLQKQLAQTARRGAEWLYRANTVKGRFVNGVRPALRVEMEDESFLHQAQAARALALAAKVFKEEKYAARAAQALLVLLDETITDPNNPKVRHTAMPSQLLDRRLSAALLLLAIHELPNPQADLLDQGEQLANYLRPHLEAKEKEAASEETDGRGSEITASITAVVASNRHRPAPWKTDLGRKTIVANWKDWQSQKASGTLPWRLEALTLAYSVAQEKPYAELSFDLGQSLASLQFSKLDPKRAPWFGGFQNPGAVGSQTAPNIRSAWLAVGMAQACSCAKSAADPTRLEQFQTSLESALQFMQTLQYSESNTLHYADWFRSRLVGGFYESGQNGDLRLDFTAIALQAYLKQIELFGS